MGPDTQHVPAAEASAPDELTDEEWAAFVEDFGPELDSYAFDPDWAFIEGPGDWAYLGSEAANECGYFPGELAADTPAMGGIPW